MARVASRSLIVLIAVLIAVPVALAVGGAAPARTTVQAAPPRPQLALADALGTSPLTLYADGVGFPVARLVRVVLSWQGTPLSRQQPRYTSYTAYQIVRPSSGGALTARLSVPVQATAFATFTARVVATDARTNAPLAAVTGAFTNKGGALTPAAVAAPATTPAPTLPGSCAGHALAVPFVSGALTCASAQGLAVAPAGATAVVVPLRSTTQVCRGSRGCQATWRDLRPGDYVDIALSTGSAGPAADRIDANMVAGDGTIRARTATSVTIDAIGRDGAASRVRVLNVLPTTLVTVGSRTDRGATGRLRIGDIVHFAASADSPRLLTAPLWAMSLSLIQTR